IERADAMDHLVAQLRPGQTHVVIADMVAHAHGTRREDGDVGAALALKLELRAFEALADLVVGHLQRRLGRLLGRLLDVLHLLLAPSQQVFRLGRVVAVAIGAHDTVAFRESWARAGEGRTEMPGPPGLNATNRPSSLSNRDWGLLGCRAKHERRGKAWPTLRVSTARSGR